MVVVMPAAAVAAAPPVAPSPAATADPLSRGMALRRAGRPLEAVPLLERATEAQPRDADAWLELGLACSAAGRLAQAQAALDRALVLAPDYVDAQVARARLDYFRGDLGQARSRAQAILARHPGQDEASRLLAQVAAAEAALPARWRLDAAWTYGDLSRGLPAASATDLAITRRLADHRAIGGSVEIARQFDQTDAYGELVYGWRAGYLALGGTPHAHFRPQWALRGGLTGAGWRLGAWRAAPGLDLGWARYPVGDVRSATPWLDLARGDRLGVTLRWYNVLDETDRRLSGFGVAGRWRAAAPLQLTAGYADAPESDAGRTMRVRTVSLGAAWEADAALTLRVIADHEARRLYDRDDLALGLTRRF